MLKQVIEIVNVEEKSGDDWELRNIEIASDKGGKYFSAFKMQFVEGRAGKILMEGWDELKRGKKGLVEYTETENPKNAKYPYKNIHGFFPTDDDSEFPQIDLSEEDEKKYGIKTAKDSYTLEEKVNILWDERII